MTFPETALPAHLRERATLRGNEFAWRIGDIPDVIEAARVAGLASVGGQLQFRTPSATCECYWVEVNTYRTVRTNLPWPARVEQTAAAARSQFDALQRRYDFITEGRSSFGSVLDEFEATGGNLNDAMCFVWYVDSEEGAAERH